MDDGETSVNGNIAELVFTENGDGTVTVTMSDEYPITIADSTDPELNSAVILLKTTGLEMNVSGTPEEMNFAMSADRYTVSLDEAVENGEPVPVEMVLNMNEIAGNYVVATSEMRNMTYDITASSVDVLVDGTDGSDTVSISGQFGGLAMNADIAMPVTFDPAMPETMFADGLDMTGGYEIGKSAFLFDITADGQPMNGTMAIDGTTVAVAMNAGEMSYDTKTTGLNVTLNAPDIPFPVDVSAAEAGMGIQMPMAKTDEPTDFAARINLTDVAVNEEIWSMIDPGAALPHDPATAQIDLSGTAKMFFDILDPTQAEAMAMAPVPGELHSLALNNLKLAIAGALVTGQGAFTFDNTDLVSFQGMPRPEGTLDLQVNGANGLMDKLVAMGLLPEEQIMGARMMLGMFATVVGDDQLTSKLEVNAAGEVYANGQRIK
jgi:hypothetical protein